MEYRDEGCCVGRDLDQGESALSGRSGLTSRSKGFCGRNGLLYPPRHVETVAVADDSRPGGACARSGSFFGPRGSILSLTIRISAVESGEGTSLRLCGPRGSISTISRGLVGGAQVHCS
jgi:hypothetical protein